MLDKFKQMESEDFVRMIETMTQFDTSSKDVSVREIREELSLTRDEYNELYNCSLPSIRGYNEGKFCRSAYHSLEQNLEKGWPFNASINSTTS